MLGRKSHWRLTSKISFDDEAEQFRMPKVVEVAWNAIEFQPGPWLVSVFGPIELASAAEAITRLATPPETRPRYLLRRICLPPLTLNLVQIWRR